MSSCIRSRESIRNKLRRPAWIVMNNPVTFALARWLLCAAIAFGAVQSADAQTRISALEIGQLPRYCWGSYDPKFEGMPGYSITNCGAGMNHFCSGLTYMLRANKPGIQRAQKIDNVVQARREIGYTLVRVTPTCPILADVQLADQRLRVMELSVGIKPPPLK